jgi:hypothetical protein
LGAIFFIEKGNRNRVSNIDLSELKRNLFLNELFLNISKKHKQKDFIDMVDENMQNIIRSAKKYPCIRLTFRKNMSFWNILLKRKIISNL